MPTLPMITAPSGGRSAPSSSRLPTPSYHTYFAPSSFKNHPLFQTSSQRSFAAPFPPSGSSSSLSLKISQPKFSNSFSGSGNYRDESLGSLKRKEDLKERSKVRKQQSIVERARMKQELLKIEELKRQRRVKLRELKRRQREREVMACVDIQRSYRGYFARSTLAIERYILSTEAANAIIRAYRTYCLVRIAKADRGVMDKIRAEDRAARLLQSKVVMWRLRKQALSRISELREIREQERIAYIRELRENAANYIQRIFRGIHDRSKVIKMAVNKQIEAAECRIGEGEVDEEAKSAGMVNSRKNRYLSKMKPKS
mmetsp:Transcript_12845/g.26221  ORF Transcript_12845/g.26221 Transcript_12845/m.26221 type:complete len:314 (+) Transcript_12845:180-1121(+)